MYVSNLLYMATATTLHAKHTHQTTKGRQMGMGVQCKAYHTVSASHHPIPHASERA